MGNGRQANHIKRRCHEVVAEPGFALVCADSQCGCFVFEFFVSTKKMGEHFNFDTSM